MKKLNHIFALAAMTVMLTQAHAENWLTNGLVAYYPFNGDANDASGNGKHGTAAGNYFFSTNGLPFSGAINIIGNFAEGYLGGGHVALPSFRGIISDTFTLSIWAKDEQFPVLSTEAYMVLGTEGSGGYWVRIEVGGGTDDAVTPKRIQFVVAGGPNNIGVTLTTTNLPASFFQNWKHIVLVKDANGISGYLNGSLVSSTNVSFTLDPQSYNAIGRHWWGNGSSSSARLTATLDDARIYNRALSSSEVAQLYGIQTSAQVEVARAVFIRSSNLLVGTNYQVQVSGDLNTWTNYGGIFTATNSLWRSTNYCKGVGS